MSEAGTVNERSRTGALFHMVDQLSHWSEFTHPQYDRWAPPADDPEARELLAAHAALRRRQGWGPFDRALRPTSIPPRAALEVAVAEGALSRSEADEEATILEKLEPRFSSRLEIGQGRANELVDLLADNRKAFANMLTSWLIVVDLPAPSAAVPVVLVPSPGGGTGGGGANGGVIVVEVPERGPLLPTLTTIAHELAHALVDPKRSMLAETAKRCGADLDTTTVGEALAYAIAPGSFAYGSGHDALERMEARLPPGTYRRFATLALAVRPRMVEALRTRRANALPELLDAICAAARAEDSAKTPPSRAPR